MGAADPATGSCRGHDFQGPALVLDVCSQLRITLSYEEAFFNGSIAARPTLLVRGVVAALEKPDKLARTVVVEESAAAQNLINT